MDDRFDDLLQANAEYQRQFDDGGLPGSAARGVMMITCMDSRVAPLRMIGLQVGDAKIIRTPGAHLTEDALVGAVLGVHLLGVDRIMIVAHTRCAMTGGDDAAVAAAIREATGADLGDLHVGADPDQEGRLAADVARLRDHRLIKDRAAVGGFVYDVDTGALKQLF